MTLDEEALRALLAAEVGPDPSEGTTMSVVGAVRRRRTQRLVLAAVVAVVVGGAGLVVSLHGGNARSERLAVEPAADTRSVAWFLVDQPRPEQRQFELIVIGTTCDGVDEDLRKPVSDVVETRSTVTIEVRVPARSLPPCAAGSSLAKPLSVSLEEPLGDRELQGAAISAPPTTNASGIAAVPDRATRARLLREVDRCAVPPPANVFATLQADGSSTGMGRRTITKQNAVWSVSWGEAIVNGSLSARCLTPMRLPTEGYFTYSLTLPAGVHSAYGTGGISVWTPPRPPSPGLLTVRLR